MIHILVVDDEQVILQSFQTAFAKHTDKYIVDTASSAEDALEKLKKRNYDLMFTDLKMPGMDGLKLIRFTRDQFPKMDVVMMTGYSSVDNAVDAMKSGAIEYIMKPFTVTELFEMVQHVMDLRNQKIFKREEITGFERFSRNIRLQHITLIFFFSLLTFTGVPLFFPNLFKHVFLLSESSVLRGILHRIAGVGLMGLGIYHILYIMITDDGHLNMKQMLPRFPKDVLDAINMIRYNLGMIPNPPRFGKYNFIEKFEYFAVVWGTIIMAVTGLFLWFSEAVITVYPVWVVDVAKVIHHYEAILAILSIAIWHMYTVHLKPEYFPMNRVWLTGRINRKEMIHHYPLEYERLTGQSTETALIKESAE